MYLLYEAEYDATVKGEQKKLLRWVREAAKLNPNVDLETIIENASRYVDSNVYRIKRPSREDTQAYKAQLALTAPAKPPVVVTKPSDTSNAQQPQENVLTPPTSAEQPNEGINNSEDYAPPLEMQEGYVEGSELPEETMQEEFEQIQQSEAMVGASNYEDAPSAEAEESEVPYIPEGIYDSSLEIAPPAIDFTREPEAELPEAEKIDPAVEEYVNTALPARIALTAEAEKAEKIRENRAAVYSDPKAIQDL